MDGECDSDSSRTRTDVDDPQGIAGLVARSQLREYGFDNVMTIDGAIFTNASTASIGSGIAAGVQNSNQLIVQNGGLMSRRGQA